METIRNYDQSLADAAKDIPRSSSESLDLLRSIDATLRWGKHVVLWFVIIPGFVALLIAGLVYVANHR